MFALKIVLPLFLLHLIVRTDSQEFSTYVFPFSSSPPSSSFEQQQQEEQQRPLLRQSRQVAEFHRPKVEFEPPRRALVERQQQQQPQQPQQAQQQQQPQPKQQQQPQEQQQQPGLPGGGLGVPGFGGPLAVDRFPAQSVGVSTGINAGVDVGVGVGVGTSPTYAEQSCGKYHYWFARFGGRGYANELRAKE